MNIKKKQKRIVFFLPNFDIGGASESILKLAKFLIKYNFSILIISLGKNFYKKDFKKINCEIIEIKSKKTSLSIFKLRKIMINEINKNFDKVIFISNINYANIISIISLINLHKIRIILTERSSISELRYSDTLIKKIKNKLIYFLAKFLYKYSDLVITNSKFEKKYIQDKFQLKRIICIHPPSIKNIIKTNKNNNKKIPHIIYVGRLSREKGIFVILEALLEIKKKYSFVFNFYGDGPDKQSIKKFIQKNNLKDMVFLKGFIKNKNFIFKNANLFINASHWEGLPNALVQSINYNVFPICSDAPGGNIEVIKNGKFGMSFKTNNKNDLQKKIIKFFNKRFKFNNRNRVAHLKNFTEEKSNQEYLETLNNLK
jgi:N-acetylgalactosamine-N,N'-diacetylbacillosaminyl-diphospho-undecaprenol 4-alpha-N-acetylgalactosaminyltransferase